MRPRLSQTPRRIPSIWAGDLSGNAAIKLARPTRFSGNKGPIVRMNWPATFPMVSGLVRRNNFRRPTVTAPTAELAPRLIERFRRRVIRLMVAASKLDDDFADHLTAFQACQTTFKIGEIHFGIDDRSHSGRDLRQTVANIAHRRAKRAKNLILLLK